MCLCVSLKPFCYDPISATFIRLFFFFGRMMFVRITFSRIMGFALFFLLGILFVLFSLRLKTDY